MGGGGGHRLRAAGQVYFPEHVEGGHRLTAAGMQTQHALPSEHREDGPALTFSFPHNNETLPQDSISPHLPYGLIVHFQAQLEDPPPPTHTHTHTCTPAPSKVNELYAATMGDWNSGRSAIEMSVPPGGEVLSPYSK